MEQKRFSLAQQRALDMLAGHGPMGQKCVNGVCPAYLLDGRTLRGLVRLGFVTPASLVPHGPVDGYCLIMKPFTQKIFHGASNRHEGSSDVMLAELYRQIESLMSMDRGLACHEPAARLARRCLAHSIRVALGI